MEHFEGVPRKGKVVYRFGNGRISKRVILGVWFVWVEGAAKMSISKVGQYCVVTKIWHENEAQFS